MDNLKPEKYFTSSNVSLAAMERSDMPLVASWINDERISYYNGIRLPVSLEEQTAWFDRVAKDRGKKKLIIRNARGTRVGMVSIFNQDDRNRNAEVGVYVAPRHMGRGYALEALAMLLRYAFLELNLHKVYARIFDFNKPSIKLFEKLGFRKEAVLKDELFTGGKYQDVLVYTIYQGDREW